jgi:hypothetical protein
MIFGFAAMHGLTRIETERTADLAQPARIFTADYADETDYTDEFIWFYPRNPLHPRNPR